MAAFDHVQNMYDIPLKPRLLRSLIKEYVPNEKHPFRNPSDLSYVVSTIKTHGLLSELATESTDKKQVENWKAAVDAWVDRLLMLVSSNMPDKCWAGICLLGVTCQECSLERFLASYSVWFHKLLSHLQPLAESHVVKVAFCVSMSDLLTRLAGLPNVKKDGTSHAAKLVQPILKMLSDDTSDAVWEGAICLLCTIITSFPSSVHRHYDSAEAAITLKLMSGKCSHTMLEKLGYCLAVLPKSRGDEDSWSLMMQKILLSLNALMNDAFQGLEEDTKTNEVMRVLVPPGKDPPPPLGGQIMLQTSEQAIKRPERSVMPTISALMCCCCTMITNSYPVKVTVPIRPLLMLAGRVLMVDGSLPHALYPFLTAMQQELICSELPALHLCSLELISGIVKVVRSQLLPHAAEIVRLLTEYFRRCAMAKLRIKVYATIRMLLMSMGVGMTIYLTQEVINNAFVDLGGYHGSEACSKAYLKTSFESLLQPTPRKRKHETTILSMEEQSNEVRLRNNPTPVSVKIAALEALETLLAVGGAFRSDKWRSNVDRLLATVATDACKGGWAKEEKNVFRPSEPSPTWGDFQLAALRAFSASLISPARVRPPYLAHGLELYRRGMQETGTKLAEFCAQALLALEVFIHPRALPLIDFASDSGNSFDGVKSRFQENILSSVQKLNSFPGGRLRNRPGDPESEDDDLYESWLRIGNESEAPVTDLGKTTSDSKTITSIVAEKQLSAENSSGAKVPEGSEQEAALSGAMNGLKGKGKEILVETQAVPETAMQIEENTPPEAQTKAPGGSMNTQSGMVASASGAFDAMDAEMHMGKDVMATSDGEKGSGKDVLASKGGDDVTTVGGQTFATIPSSSRTMKDFVFAVDNESAMDEIPDIIDVEPDSDEN